MLGDCFLKLAVVLKIYTEYEGVQEGKMVKLKSMRVSNRYLFDLAHKKSLDEYIVAQNCTKRENCLGPWTTGRKQQQQQQQQKQQDSLAIKLPDKSLADCIEALIGCYLIHLGTQAAMVFIEWLDYVVSDQHGPARFLDQQEAEVEALKSIGPRVTNDMANLLKNRYGEFEASLGYEFKNKAYLYQAFTHPSDTSNIQTSSYQK